MNDGDSSERPSDGAISAPTPEDASGYGLTLTLVGAVLLALAYYGIVAIQGTHDLGGALPTPFYALALAFLFAVDVLASRRLDAISLARAIAFTAVYGALFVLAVEGGAYLGENPDAALDGFAGLTVLAGALVVSVLVYVGYLTVIETNARR